MPTTKLHRKKILEG